MSKEEAEDAVRTSARHVEQVAQRMVFGMLRIQRCRAAATLAQSVKSCNRKPAQDPNANGAKIDEKSIGNRQQIDRHRHKIDEKSILADVVVNPHQIIRRRVDPKSPKGRFWRPGQPTRVAVRRPKACPGRPRDASGLSAFSASSQVECACGMMFGRFRFIVRTL